MAYENTSVAVSKSQEKIRQILITNAATHIAFVSQMDPLSEGFEAVVIIDDTPYRMRITAKVCKIENHSKARRYRGIYRSAKTDSQVQEEELRRVWRVLYYHLKSVYEAVNSGVMEFREIMMPYLVVRDGRTIAQHILPELQKAIESRPERLLTSGSK